MVMPRNVLRFIVLTAVLSAGGAALAPHGAGAASAPARSAATARATPAATAVLDPRTGNARQFFRTAHVYNFELTISAADFARMPPKNGAGGRGMGGFGGAADATEARGSGYDKVPAQLRFDGKDWGTVEIRYKGNSSYRGARSDLKRSIKLDFNVPGRRRRRRFFGMSKLNLNNNAFDASEMRETLAYAVYRQAAVPAPRTAFARVFITVPGQYQRAYAGLFTVVEQIDQHFFVERWKHKVGLLLKPEGLSGLPDLGREWSNYAASYSSKIPAKGVDARRFIAFVQFVDHASDAEFAAHIGDYLDVDEFLRFLAVEVVTVNSDSPLAMNHNYYLTVRPATGKVEWVPWDMNMAFGGFRRGEVNLSLYHASAPGMFPLADRVLSVPALLERYRQIVRGMLRTNFTRERMDALMQRVAGSIGGAVALDPTTNTAQLQRNLAANPPLPRRLNTLNGGTGGGPAVGGLGFRDHDGPPLRRFISDRIDSVRNQLSGKSEGVAGRAGFGFGPD